MLHPKSLHALILSNSKGNVTSGCLTNIKINFEWFSLLKYMQHILSIVCKKTDEWYSSDKEWQQWEVQWVKNNGHDWQQVVKRMTTSSTARDNDWQLMTTSDNKW